MMRAVLKKMKTGFVLLAVMIVMAIPITGGGVELYPLRSNPKTITEYKGKMYNDAGKIVNVPEDIGRSYEIYYNKEWSGAILRSISGPCYYVDRDLNFKLLCNHNTCAAISFNGEAVVYGQSDGGGEKALYWYDVEKDKSYKVMTGYVNSATLSPNGKKVSFIRYDGKNSSVFVAEKDSRPEPVAKGDYDVISVSDAGEIICSEYLGKFYSFSDGQKTLVGGTDSINQYCLNNKCTQFMFVGKNDKNVYYYEFGMDGSEMVYEGSVGTLKPGAYHVRQSNRNSSLHQDIYDTESLLGTVFCGAKMTPYMFHGVDKEIEQFPARSTVYTINTGDDYTVMIAQSSKDNRTVTVKKYKDGECLDEKIFDDITKESVACDERGRCFYIVDDFGVLYRYEDGELKEIDKKAKAGGNDGMKVNVLDGLLYYRKDADLYVTGDETKPTVVAEHCDSITSGMGTEYNVFYYDMSGKTHALIFGNDFMPY
jgi:hypothetical protein